MTKIDIFSGFLGAGKTTLIRQLIAKGYTNEKLVLIENEFGEIGIDGSFLKEAGIEMKEMNSGCICCSLVGDFKEALKKVMSEMKPDRILIEPSGVGKLSDVIRAVQAVEMAHLDHVVTVVDVLKCKMYMKNFGEFFNDQVAYAKTIILSRTQKANAQKISEVVAMIKEKNEDVRILTTPWDQLSAKQIVEAMDASRMSIREELFHDEHDHECGCGHHHHEHDHECTCGHHHEHHHHHADEIFTAWGKETVKIFSLTGLQQRLKQLGDPSYGQILRAKGIVQGEGTWYYFDWVPEECEIREGQADYTGRLCVIGSKLDETKLEALFLGDLYD